MKALASLDSFFGLSEQGKFATGPVRRSFLIKRVMPERFTCNPSLFKVLNIPAGWGYPGYTGARFQSLYSLIFLA